MENKNQKPLTLDQLVKYNQEVLLPAIGFVFDKKIDNLVTKKEFHEFKDESLTNQDAMLKKLDILMEDKDVRQYQDEKRKKFFAIMIKAMKEHSILSPKDLEEIAHLDIF